MTEDDKLDADWINEFENIDVSYNKFYKEGNDLVRVTYVYVGKNNTIEHVKREKVILRPQNILPYSVLLDLIHTHTEGFAHEFDFLIKYNVTLDPSDVKYIIKRDYHDTYIHETSRIDSLVFENTISMFQDLNEVFIFFRDKPVSSSNNKTIKFRTHRPNSKSNNHKRTVKMNK